MPDFRVQQQSKAPLQTEMSILSPCLPQTGHSLLPDFGLKSEPKIKASALGWLQLEASARVCRGSPGCRGPTYPAGPDSPQAPTPAVAAARAPPRAQRGGLKRARRAPAPHGHQQPPRSSCAEPRAPLTCRRGFPLLPAPNLRRARETTQQCPLQRQLHPAALPAHVPPPASGRRHDTRARHAGMQEWQAQAQERPRSVGRELRSGRGGVCAHGAGCRTFSPCTTCSR